MTASSPQKALQERVLDKLVKEKVKKGLCVCGHYKEDHCGGADKNLCLGDMGECHCNKHEVPTRKDIRYWEKRAVVLALAEQRKEQLRWLEEWCKKKIKSTESLCPKTQWHKGKVWAWEHLLFDVEERLRGGKK